VTQTPDIVVIGGGVNGLVTATLLAKAGLKTIVLEQSDRVGGCARTSEIAPGFRCPTLAHSAAIDPALVRTLGLERHGLRIIRPAADACAPTKDGRALVLWCDAAKAGEEIRAFSAKDAAQYPKFLRTVTNISGMLRAVLESPPPSIDDPSAGDLFELLKTGRKFRALGKADAYRVLRWMPMAVADLAGEWFESEPLRATVAAGGILGSFLGPWSAGSAALLLLLAAREGEPIANGWFAAGGPGALADALAAAALSGRIRLAQNIDGIERAFDAAKYGGFAEEPWIELTLPSIADPGLAPSGQHVVSAYVQYAPYHLRGTNWDAERDRLAAAATRTIAQYAPGFESTVVAREVITPLDLERTYGLTGGHIFHGELALDQFFVTRPLLGWARYTTPIKNLFLCGSGTHPGTGLDGRSGALAAREIVKHVKG
jgi:phytoene dehydrogenase-like protein